MNAIVLNAYGGPEVLELKQVEEPQITENDVLIAVHAVGLNAGDYFSMRGSPWLIRFSIGFPKPKNHILGWDAAGIVKAVGSNVTRLQPGDKVFAACDAALAEYVCVSEDRVELIPVNLSLVQSSALPCAATTALQALRDQLKLKPGQRILINGASGGVGTFSVQIAKSYGAEVTGVCSTRSAELVRSLGADHVIDYTKEDFTKGGVMYDYVLDNRGNRSFADYRRVLAPGGVHLSNTGHGGMRVVLQSYVFASLMRQHARPFMCVPKAVDLRNIKHLVESEKVTPVIDKVFPMSNAPQALRYLEEEHPRGKVVISVRDDEAG